MNPGIFYLYEYENNKRKRNVGFIKIARRYQTCILQIHIRGISTGNGASLELYAFYRDGNAMAGTQIATLTCFGKTVSERLPVSERSFPEGRPLSEMDGFLIKLPGDKPAVFWMASAFFFPVDISQLRPPAAPEEEPETIPAPAPEEEPETVSAPAPEEEPETVSAPAPDNVEAEDPGNTEAPVPESNRESSESPSVFSDGISGQERESAAEDREYRKEKKKSQEDPALGYFRSSAAFLVPGQQQFPASRLSQLQPSSSDTRSRVVCGWAYPGSMIPGGQSCGSVWFPAVYAGVC